jgi:hypothetical protein
MYNFHSVAPSLAVARAPENAEIMMASNSLMAMMASGGNDNQQLAAGNGRRSYRKNTKEIGAMDEGQTLHLF